MREPADVKAAIEHHRDTVFRIAYTYLRSSADADDVAQDVFVKLMRSDQRFESDAHLRNWLVRVTVNECKTLFRRPWRRVEDIEQYAESLALPTEEHENLLVSVMKLPEKYRVPLVLHYYGDFSCGEIAEMLGVPSATVRTRLARGRARLKTMLKEDSDAGEQQAARGDVVHARI